jgi:LacI family transcriptional regulator
LPTVLMNTSVEKAAFSTLNLDNYGGALAMTQHLIGRGHRRIAMVCGPDGNFDASERLRGFHAAIAKSQPRVEAQVVDGDFTEESGYRAGKQLLAAAKRPTAVFAANDMMAVGCMYALIESGVRVPDDIGLAGFDDIPISRYVNPPLTTVRVRIADLGRSALERLAMRLENPDAAQPLAETLGCEIVVRASCGVTANIHPRHNNKTH